MVCIYIERERERTRKTEDTTHTTHTLLVWCVYIQRKGDCDKVDCEVMYKVLTEMSWPAFENRKTCGPTDFLSSRQRLSV